MFKTRQHLCVFLTQTLLAEATVNKSVFTRAFHIGNSIAGSIQKSVGIEKFFSFHAKNKMCSELMVQCGCIQTHPINRATIYWRKIENQNESSIDCSLVLPSRSSQSFEIIYIFTLISIVYLTPTTTATNIVANRYHIRIADEKLQKRNMHTLLRTINSQKQNVSR